MKNPFFNIFSFTWGLGFKNIDLDSDFSENVPSQQDKMGVSPEESNFRSLPLQIYTSTSLSLKNTLFPQQRTHDFEMASDFYFKMLCWKYGSGWLYSWPAKPK